MCSVHIPAYDVQFLVSNMQKNILKYVSFKLAAFQRMTRLVSGHPPGGVAIFWRKNLDQYIKPMDLKCDWCTAIEFNTGSNTVVIINVYLPYQCPAFLTFLSHLSPPSPCAG